MLVSGGHSLLAIVEDVNKFYTLGTTLDNAPGEIFDKVYLYKVCYLYIYIYIYVYIIFHLNFLINFRLIFLTKKLYDKIL